MVFGGSLDVTRTCETEGETIGDFQAVSAGCYIDCRNQQQSGLRIGLTTLTLQVRSYRISRRRVPSCSTPRQHRCGDTARDMQRDDVTHPRRLHRGHFDQCR